MDVGGGADRIEIVLQRLLDRRFALREHADHPAGGVASSIRRTDALARNRQRHEGIRKQHRVAQRQDGQLAGNRQRPLTGRPVVVDVEAISSADRSWAILLMR